MRQLIELWATTLGTPPADEQFVVWTESYGANVVRRAILATATRNLKLNGAMDTDYKIRFASKVMIIQTERNVANAANRERLHKEFEGSIACQK
jgi:hypothetical protein